MLAKSKHNAAQCTPRKARLLRGIIMGKPAVQAIALLSVERRAGSVALRKLIRSAMAQLPREAAAMAKVVDVVVNEGPRRRFFMPRAQGRATQVLKRTSHLSVTLKIG